MFMNFPILPRLGEKRCNHSPDLSHPSHRHKSNKDNIQSLEEQNTHKKLGVDLLERNKTVWQRFGLRHQDRLLFF